MREYFNIHGFQIIEDSWEANEFKLTATKVIHGVEIPFEIHRELLWKSKMQWEFTPNEKIPFQTLRLEDELIYLCGHLAHQHTMLSLHWLMDIALILQNNLKWDTKRIDSILKEVPLKTSFSSCLFACEKHLDIKIPLELTRYIKKDPKNKIIQRLMTEKFLKNPTNHRWTYLSLKHLLKDRLLDSIEYDFQWLKHRFVKNSNQQKSS